MHSTSQSRWRLGLHVSLGVGVAAAIAGIFLWVLALTGGGPPVRFVGALLVAFALLELGVGVVVGHQGGAGMALVLSGAVCIAFAVYAISPLASSAAAIALLIAIYLCANTLFRTLDLLIDHPRPWVTETFYAATAAVLAVYLLMSWQHATPKIVGLVIGAELIARAVAMLGSTRMIERHPDWDGYRAAH